MNKNSFKKVISLDISHIKIKISIIALFLMSFTQITFAEDSVQKNSNNGNSSKCKVMKMKGNVVIKSDLATVYTDKKNRIVVLLPKSDKKNTTVLEADSQECD